MTEQNEYNQAFELVQKEADACGELKNINLSLRTTRSLASDGTFSEKQVLFCSRKL
jgi:hypothetical protein